MNKTFQAINEGTRKLEKEIELRCRLNPELTRRIANFGFIELEDTWGDEATIINTARISSTNKRLPDLSAFTEKDNKLLYLLLKHNHGTPFETVYFRFRFIAPIFVMRQWVKHRISSWNEFSQRYRKPISAAYAPDKDARTVDGFEVLGEDQVEEYTELTGKLFEWYEEQYQKACERIDAAREKGEIPQKSGGRDPYRGRARELLRNVTPVAAYSDVYWTVNFRSLMNFFNLRRKPDAQYEIRQYADAAFDMFRKKFPLLGEIMQRVLDEQDI